MTRPVALIAVFAVIAAVPVLTWWIVGDVSEEGAEDIMFRAPDLPATVDLILVFGAVTLFVCGLALIMTPAGRGHVGRREWSAMLPLLLLGLFVGFGGRLVTARVGGANIGGGLLWWAAPVVVPLLIIWSAVLWIRPPNSD